jgi:uncharacterized membrane protein
VSRKHRNQGDSVAGQIVTSEQQQLSVSTSFSGPIPPPLILKQYDDLVPGAAARILAQAEQQTAHRIALENNSSMER